MTNAAQFNATGERLTRSTGPSPNAAYTVAFWVRVDSYRNTDYQTLFTFLQGGSEWEAIMLDASNRLVIEAGVGGSGSRVNAASAYGTGTWKYVALVRSSTTSLKAYVDGTEVLSLTTNVSSRSAAVSEFAFGSDTYNEDSNSSVAYARAWTAALNTTELAAERTSATAVRTTDLWGDWPMQANGNDSSGNSRTLSANGTVSYVTDGPTWSQTITPAAAALVMGATSPTVTAGSSVTVTPAAATLALGATSPTAIMGAIATTPGAAALVMGARCEVLLNACTAGLVHVSSANPRYFANDAGIIPLAGFHTWETLVDQDATDPPGAFDFDAFLAAGVAKGCNFLKLWACESLRDWCDLELYFSPYIYNRPGPGTANDGKAKVDLAAFNQTYFDRLRARAIEAGNRGMYVCVQLFQGWQVTQKGYAVGAPGTYHPFNAANNVNSIDGDIDNDGQVGETRDITWTAVFDLQKAYVAKVVDTVGDLDHVIYEISNEEDEVDNASGRTKVEWQHALIDYIHTYEAGLAKQHPVGMTVQWPSGSDSDLFASNAEWISPKDVAAVTSVTASNGDKVILWDTDHIVGLTDEHEWVWRAFTRGCSPLYMDEWDGGFYGTDKRLTAANERIRANLGYVLDYAARLDLATATPQGSLASTGYALANTTQLIAYQPGSGAFTVNLASLSGTFAVEWLRTSTGATQAGSNVDGGAVRTLTPPWAGEDVVAFLEKLGETISPTAAALALGAASPAIILGALTITPAAAQLAAVAASPAVILAAVAITPSAAQAGITASDPAIILGAVVVAPSVAVLALGATDPATVLGALTVSPNAAALALSAASPDVQAGGAITVSPTAAPVGMGATDPAVSLGAISLTPASAALALSATDPVIGVGGLDITPAAAVLALGATDPAVSLGAIAISPDAATIAVGATSPTLLFGAATITPSPAPVGMGATNPNVVIGVIVAAVTLTARRNFTLTSRRSFTLTYRR